MDTGSARGQGSIAIGFFSQPTLISQAHCQKTYARGRSKEMMQTVNKCDESVKCVQLRALIGSRRRMRKRSRLGACSRSCGVGLACVCERL
jgi:hypothetical protein